LPSTYDIGDIVRAIGTFTSTAGANTDPTTVKFLWDTPTSTGPTIRTRTSTAVGAVGGITKEAAGIYWSEFNATGAGLYEWRFTSTGTITASGESWASVRPRRVTT
jgi:hypothetical protein